MSLPEESLEGTHCNDEGMKRRLAAYHKVMDTSAGQENVITFFKQNNIDVLELDVDKIPEDEIFVKMKNFIDRNGKFSNYMSWDEEEAQAKRSVLEQEKNLKDSKLKNDITRANDLEKEKRRLQEEEYTIKMKALEDQEREILDKKSQPLRQYMAERVVPVLTMGLLEVCKKIPEDPVDFLVRSHSNPLMSVG